MEEEEVEEVGAAVADVDASTLEWLVDEVVGVRLLAAIIELKPWLWW